MIPSFEPTTVHPAETADITDPARQAGGVLTISPAEYAQLERELAPVVDAFAASARALVAGRGMVSLASELGVDQRLCDVLPGGFSERTFDLLRLDFILSGGEPVVLEANFGAAVGGSIDVEAHATAAGISNYAPNSARMRWAGLQALRLGHRELFLPHWPWSHISDPDTYFGPSRAVAASVGVALRVLSFDEFAALLRDDPAPRVALRLFASLDAARREIDLDALGYNPGSGVTWLQDEAAAIPSNKALMASHGFQEALSPDAACVPRSALATNRTMDGFTCLETQSIRGERLNLVIKPVADHGGSGVLIGPGTSDVAWHAGVDATTENLALVQDFYATDEVDFVNRYPATGELDRFVGPVSYGAYFVQGEMTGVLARVGTEKMRNAAVNGNTGAVLSALVPREGR